MRPTDALPHPGDWTTTSVARGVDIKRGVSWSKDQEHGEPGSGRVPVIGISNVQKTLELQDLLYLSGLKPTAVEKKRVTAGWTVLVGSNGNRARVGNAVIVREDADFLFASFLLAAKPKSQSGLSPEYFYRWLSSEQVQGYLSASSEGTTGLNNLSHSFFRAMSIPVPPPEEQAAIARIVDAVDGALECTCKAVERAREVKRALVQQVFSNGLRGERQKRTAIGPIPNSWDVVAARAVVRNFQYGLSVPMEAAGRMPILRMGNIQSGNVILGDLKYVNLPEKVLAGCGNRSRSRADMV
jgi:type I restriction enzyme S subunit